MEWFKMAAARLAVPGSGWSRPIDRIVIVLVAVGAFAAGLAFVAVMPPMSGIDEPFHWERAVQVSEGGLFARRLGPNDWGGQINSGAVDLADWYVAHFPRHQPIDLQESLAVERQLSTRQDARLTNFPSTASYSALAYLPQAAGILIARTAGGDLLTQFYSGRVVNLLVYLLLVACAVWMMPFGGMAMMALLVNPHAIHLAASHSADPLNIAIPALLMAWSLRLRFDDAVPFDRAARHGIAALTLSLGLLKPTMFLLSPLIVTIPAARFKSERLRWRYIAAVIAGCAAIAVVWNGIYPFVPGPYWGTGGDPAAAIKLALANPAQTADLFYISVRDDGPGWWLDSYCRFGRHPQPFAFFTSTAPGWWALCGILALALADGSRRPDRPLALLYIVIALAYAATLLVAFYVGFSPPGAATIAGLQGRYFMLPWELSVIAIALATPARKWLAPLRMPLLLGILAMHLIVVNEAIDRYRATTWTVQPH
jgi:hypothetical protein